LHATNVVRFVGCGLVAVVAYSGYEEWTFAQPANSGDGRSALVGGAQYNKTSG
jgi:hypothetical protein